MKMTIEYFVRVSESYPSSTLALVFDRKWEGFVTAKSPEIAALLGVCASSRAYTQVEVWKSADSCYHEEKPLFSLNALGEYREARIKKLTESEMTARSLEPPRTEDE